MKTVAIISEYNPFHNGHLYQIQKIREELGEDTAIIAVMSGSFTQRGEAAIMDKGARAKAAVLEGVNLVLELPFPYSMSSAEFFADAAVHIVDSIGCVDYLSFGSEEGSLDPLYNTAELMMSDEYRETLNGMMQDEKYKTYGYPELVELAINAVRGERAIALLTPNNILGIEYIKALMKRNSSVKPHTIARIGNEYNEESIVSGIYQSASAIRKLLLLNSSSAYDYIPNTTKNIILREKESEEFPCDTAKLSAAIISNLRLSSPEQSCRIHDAGGGLYNRLKDKSFETNDINTLLSLCEAKSYTKARLRRTILASLFGVTSSEVKSMPQYTQILAFDAIGQLKLKHIRKQSRITVLTKPSDYEKLNDTALKQKLISDRADSIFELCKPNQPDGRRSLRYTPFVKK